MDPTLIQNLKNQAHNSLPLREPTARFSSRSKSNCGRRATAWVTLVLGWMLTSGCQTGNLLNQKLPVPPASLASQPAETVRFQSPGSGSRNASPGGATGKVESYTPSYGEALAPGEDEAVPIDQSNVITDIVIKGNRIVPTHKVIATIRTRVGRYFDADKLQRDIDQLWRLPEISRINGPYINRSAAGVVITIDIVERDVIRGVQFVGNRGISDRALRKATGLEEGLPLNAHEIRMAKTKIEEFYKEKGFPRTQVELTENPGADASNVVFLIHEDQKQRVWKVEFEGNEIASDGRLKSFIESKPGIAKVFGGVVKRDEIDQDILRLTNYYRSLGFFNARIGREVNESEDGRWATIRFIINEGPRYRIRNVAFIGNGVYASEQLKSMVELKPAEGEMPEFNSSKMNQDVVALRELYGAEGFVFAQVEAEPRFLEEPGLLDLVYKIDEGKQYRVGKINVHFEGDYGITKREVVLNRLGLSPGDKIDANAIRIAERQLGSAQIFAGRGTPGSQPPKIVVRPPELEGASRTKRR